VEIGAAGGGEIKIFTDLLKGFHLRRHLNIEILATKRRKVRDLSLSTLTVQVGLDGPLTCSDYFHVTGYNIIIRKFNR